VSETSTQPIIEFHKVSKAFNGTPVLDAIDLAIRPGETTVIIGPSGCGKSVMLKHMIALLRPDAGKVRFDGTTISRLPERRLVPIRRRAGFLFQGGALFDSMTIEENICFPLHEHEIGTPPERPGRAHEVLAQVGLGGLEHRFPEELSGGQKKRAALARAIVMKPEVILYDEPTTGLDPIRSGMIDELILKLQEELETTAVVVTHDMTSARRVGDRIVMLYDGKLIADTTPEGLDSIDDEAVLRFVEGRASADELDSMGGSTEWFARAGREARSAGTSGDAG
jgi:phospholipid/cholesterol/gamma-HCH transport system ATP-binding protein